MLNGSEQFDCQLTKSSHSDFKPFLFYHLADMRWFGRVVPLIAMGKKTEKQPVYVRTLKGCCH